MNWRIICIFVLITVVGDLNLKAETISEKERLRVRAEETVQQQNSVLSKVLNILLKEGVPKVSAYIERHAGSLPSSEQNQAWKQLVDSLEQAGRLGETVLSSFAAQRGEEIAVDLKSGRMRLKIAGVKDGMILYYAKIGKARLKKHISLSQLSDNELNSRVGDDVLGLYLHHLSTLTKKKNYRAAKLYISRMPSPLRESLMDEIGKFVVARAADEAQNQLVAVLSMAGVAVRGIEGDPVALLDAIKSSERSDGMNLLLCAEARDLAIQYRGSEWIKDQDVVKLINFMYALKAEENGLDEEDSDDSDDSEASGDENSGESQLSVDWKKEIDF